MAQLQSINIKEIESIKQMEMMLVAPINIVVFGLFSDVFTGSFVRFLFSYHYRNKKSDTEYKLRNLNSLSGQMLH